MKTHLTAATLTDRGADWLTDAHQARRVAMALALNGDDPKAPVTWGMPTDRILLVVTGDSPTTHLIPPGMIEEVVSRPIRITTRGERVRVAAILNPYRAKRDRETLPDGTRCVTRNFRAPVPKDELGEWVAARFTPWMTPDARVLIRDLPASRGRRPDGRTVTTNRILITATGTVTDPDVLHHRLIEGHGHARAYGAGLHVLGATS